MVMGATIGMVASCSHRVVDREAQAFIDAHVQAVKPLEKAMNLAYWQANVTGEQAFYDQYAEYQLKLRRLLSDSAAFAKLKALKESGAVRDPLRARQLTLLYNQFLANQISPDLLAQIVALSTKVEQTFNTFRPTMDGRVVTANDIAEVLRTSNDSDRRRRAWEASKEVGAQVAPDLIRLVKLRNQAARALGFENYYVMALTLSEHDEENLSTIFRELAELTDEPFRRAKACVDSVLAQRYGIAPDELRPWHYHDPFFQEAPRVHELDLDGYYQHSDVVELARAFYKGIGLEVDSILARSDLFEKQGKNPHAFCTDIDREGDVRVLANVRNDARWMDTMLHELGHAVYDLYLDRRLPYLLREPAQAFTTEGIAEFFGRLALNPYWAQNMLALSDDQRQQLETAMTASARMKQLVFARWCQVMVNFERELYSDPDQDLNSLWWKGTSLCAGLKVGTRLTGRQRFILPLRRSTITTTCWGSCSLPSSTTTSSRLCSSGWTTRASHMWAKSGWGSSCGSASLLLEPGFIGMSSFSGPRASPLLPPTLLNNLLSLSGRVGSAWGKMG